MNIEKIPTGNNPPEEINVFIEISKGSLPIKYELDRDSGALFVDRFLNTSMHYPANYGFIPHTLAEDGDPLDAIVLTSAPLLPSSVISVHPIGILIMQDDKGMDGKILTIPTKNTDPYYPSFKSFKDIPESFLIPIFHFFSHYKDLEKNKWVKILKWGDEREAKRIIEKCLIIPALRKT